MEKFNNFAIGEHIWFNQAWVGPSGGTILGFNSIIDSNGNPATSVKIHLDDGGITESLLKNIYHTKEELLEINKKEESTLIANYKSEMLDIESLIRFMFDNTISTGSCEYTDWEARQAVKERVKELLNIDL